MQHAVIQSRQTEAGLVPLSVTTICRSATSVLATSRGFTVALIQPAVKANHSMTSLARTRMDCGTLRPSASAVLRLTDISNLVGT
jgi:hypothetical protein